MQDRHREAAGTAPLNTRVPGSAEWCYQTMSQLKVYYRSINTNHGMFTRYLNELREHRAWEKVPVEAPYGSEDEMLFGELGKYTAEIRAQLAEAARLNPVRVGKRERRLWRKEG